MSLTRYGYSDAVSGFFEVPTDTARKLVPSHLQPSELHHGVAILAVTCFDFNESEVGAYGELVMAVLVSPLLRPGQRLPKSAFYPYRVATTTRAAREHAIARWHLPHFMEDVDMLFERGAGALTARVRVAGVQVVGLHVTEHSWSSVSHLYQSFMSDRDGRFFANILMEGEQSEHEAERGRLELADHVFHGNLTIADVSTVPFRELWMRRGRQTFEPLLRQAGGSNGRPP